MSIVINKIKFQHFKESTRKRNSPSQSCPAVSQGNSCYQMSCFSPATKLRGGTRPLLFTLVKPYGSTALPSSFLTCRWVKGPRSIYCAVRDCQRAPGCLLALPRVVLTKPGRNGSWNCCVVERGGQWFRSVLKMYKFNTMNSW